MSSLTAAATPAQEGSERSPDLASPPCWFPLTAPLRAVHGSGLAWSIERGEMFAVRETWIYRAQIQVEGRSLSGEAVILQEQTPGNAGGFSPLARAQRTALDMALLFAGFGESERPANGLPAGSNACSPLTKRGEETEARFDQAERALRALRRMVKAQIAHLRQRSLSFAMQPGEILDMAGLLVYRATIQVAQRQFLGDVDLDWFSSADPSARAHALLSAQFAAVGTALTFAGFPPPTDPPEPNPDEERQAQASSVLSPAPLPADQRERLALLGRRLGKPEPLDERLNADEARRLLAEWEAEEAELLREAEAAMQTTRAATPRPPQEPPVAAPTFPSAPSGSVDALLVRQLKQRWREAFHPAGDGAMQRAQWHAFKTRICGEGVHDEAMEQSQYECLKQALPSLPPVSPSSPISPAGGSARTSSASPVRQAPRLASGPSARAPRRS